MPLIVGPARFAKRSPPFGVPVGDGLGPGVGVPVGVPVGDGLGPGVGVPFGVPVGDGLGPGVGVSFGVPVGDGLGNGDPDGDGVGVTEPNVPARTAPLALLTCIGMPAVTTGTG